MTDSTSRPSANAVGVGGVASEVVARRLRKVPLLSGLSDAELRPLSERIEVREYVPGTVIVAEKEPGDSLYVVLSGRVQVARHGRGTGRVPLAELGPGDFFGEMALLENAPRSADVVAVRPTTCAVLSRDTFDACLLGNKGVAAALLSTLSRRLRALNELVQRPQVGTRAPARERERRILEHGETTMANDIRHALVIKEQNHFTLFNPEGDIPIVNTAGFGLYLGDTRHLSGYEVSLSGVQAVVLSSTARFGYAAAQQLTNRDIRHGRRTIRKETMLISRECLAHEAGFQERITVSNFNLFPVDVGINIRFAADFADIFEVRGVGRPQRGVHLSPKVRDDTVLFAYQGLDNRTYETQLTFSPTPTRLRGHTMLYRLHVAPLDHASLDVHVTARVRDRGAGSRPARQAHEPALAAPLAPTHASYRDWVCTATTLDSDNELLDATVERSLVDLRLLVNRLHDRWFFSAGIPWYATLFGRDSLITGLQTLAWNPDLAAGILRLLAQYQGRDDNAWQDEEPGKILHELRTGELARINLVPHRPYYGSIDATPLFLMLAAAYYDWTGDLALLRDLRPNLEAALRWCTDRGDVDGDGYLEYARRSAKGLANQGWKDSGEGIMFHDGRLPKPPIALVEVQGYLYAAYRGMAHVLRALDPGQRAGPDALLARAARLKTRFNEDFWLPGQGYYALGLDGRKRPIDAITSNPGQALWTGIVEETRAPLVAARLLSDDLFSGWGIRTLSSQASAYNPLGYHLGTVWPHDNALILGGLRRYGCDAEASRLFGALVDAAQHFNYARLPELFCGMARTEYAPPIGYPVACSPQAWAAGAIPYMLGEMLGLRPRKGGQVLEIVRPVVPPGLQHVHLRDLRVGDSRLDLAFTRPAASGEPARVQVERQSGSVGVRLLGC
jgi:glycogen debranching enzyme/CRP-like cAMP-binding protein